MTCGGEKYEYDGKALPVSEILVDAAFAASRGNAMVFYGAEG
jgi:hypothetical protein